MKNLLEFILKEILQNENFLVEEKEDEGKVILNAKLDSKDIGLVIGKGGNTIKAIQSLLKVRAKLENKMVQINVLEKTQ